MSRVRKPTAVKLVEGTYRPDRSVPHEPKPPQATRPVAPARLTAYGKAAWDELVQLANELAVLTITDLVALEAFAEAVGDLRAAREALAAPLVVAGVEVAHAGQRFYWTGLPDAPMRRARPELAAIAEADKRVAAWVARFGLSPSDRARVSAGPPSRRSPWDEF